MNEMTQAFAASGPLLVVVLLLAVALAHPDPDVRARAERLFRRIF
ncbi:hypothetical protein [Streptomyces sp. cg36]